MVTTKKLGERIRDARVSYNWSQTDLARAIQMDRANISRMETGKHRPRTTTLDRVAKALGISARKLVG